MGHEPTASFGEAVSRRRFLLGASSAGLSGLAGCIVHGEESDLSGEIRVDGSNTVLPHSASVAEEFMWKHNDVIVPVRGSGTGAGFQQFCNGSTEVQNASRTISEDDEEPICEENGVEWVRLEVALDGLAIYAHPDNAWCDCLTVEELEAIWEPNTEVETWSDIREEWPDEELSRYGRDTASGTFDYFTEAITGNVGAITNDYSPSADTNVIIRGVSGDIGAIGFGGAGYYYENEDDLKLIAVDDGDGCVLPERETVEQEEYTPLTRPLFAYFRRDALEQEEVREYGRFYFDEIDDEAEEADIVEDGETLTWTQWAARRVGFYGIPDETVEESRETLEEAIQEVAR